MSVLDTVGLRPKWRAGFSGRFLPPGFGLLALAAVSACGTYEALALPANFQEVIAFQGLTLPTAVRFSPDGRVFVAEKSGIIKVFDSLADTTATIVVGPGAAYDLRPNVHDFWDRGLLGFALHPDFPDTPQIFVLYAYDFDPLEPSRPAPRWGDTCPNLDAQSQPIGPGPTTDGCVVNGRLSRFTVNPDNTLSGGEQVILENNWCQQFPSHSIGSLVFGPEGALYVSAGDGGSFNTEDWGQLGGTRGTPPQTYPFTPANPCADPNAPRGTATTKPNAEGGALRAQDVRTLGDSVSFDGSILRIDPVTGAAWPDNPLVGGTSAGDDRTIAYGLRNPFRINARPGTSEIWVGDVGWGTWEEINRIPNPSDSVVENFGWPCIEGPSRLGGYNGTSPNNLNLCTTLPTAATTPAYYQFQHGQVVYTDDPCDTASGSAVSGLAFYGGGTYPDSYDDALFFADHSRNCVWVMTAGGNGLPDAGTRTAFLTHIADPQQIGNPRPVDLQVGPGGDLYVVDFEGGRIRRIRYNVGNNPPTAVIQANPTAGLVPLTVQFDASGSSDPDAGATLFYAWDLDGDGQYDDGFLPQATRQYTSVGDVVVGLRVTDDDSASSTTSVTISPGNAPPVATIGAPLASVTWRVGESIHFSGQGIDVPDGNLGPGAMHWDVIMHHCPGGPEGCHSHGIQSYDDISQGDFTAPDHEYYSELEFRLTVTDSGGLADTDTVTIGPEAVLNTFESSPAGATLSVAGFEGVTPFTHGAIIDSFNSLIALTPQDIGGIGHYFVSWEDGGAASRSFVATPTPQTFHANFAACVAVESACDGLDDDCDGTVDNVPPPSGAPTLTVDDTGLSWSPLPGAVTYDVVRGSVNALQGNGFTAAAIEACVASGLADTAMAIPTNPQEGEGFWFLVRGRSCAAAGTYDSGGIGQVGSRDPGINGAPSACP